MPECRQMYRPFAVLVQLEVHDRWPPNRLLLCVRHVVENRALARRRSRGRPDGGEPKTGGSAVVRHHF